MSRARVRIGAMITLMVAGALLFLVFVTAQNALVLLGPFCGWQLEFFCALLVLAALAFVILSRGHQLSQRDNKWASWTGGLVIALTIVGLACALPILAGLGFVASGTSYWRLGPEDQGRQVVVGETSWFHSQFSVYEGNGVLFHAVPSPPSPTPGDPIDIDHWRVRTTKGQYVISYATTATGSARILFILN